MNNERVKEEIKKEINNKNYLETNENGNKKKAKMYETQQAVIWYKFMVINAHRKKSQIA